MVRLMIEEDNQKSEKRSNKNSYEDKANVIEGLKRKASTSKGLKQKKTDQDTKVRTKKASASASRIFATSAIRRDTKRMNVTVVPKRIRRTNHRQT